MIPFLDLAKQYETIREEVEPILLEVFRSGRYVAGQEVGMFEQEFAEYLDCKYAIACSSGTSALHLAYRSIDLQPGDEVIVPAMTFIATISPLLEMGVTVVLVDINLETYTIDIDALENAITEKTKAVVPVHLYGQSAAMKELTKICGERGLRVVEDSAQSHGANYGNDRCGTIGDLGCFSFYPGKNLGALGEGGIVATNDEKLADSVRSLRDWGQSGKANHIDLGFNYRMDNVQGAALRVKLRKLDSWNEARRAKAAAYDEKFSKLGLETPRIGNYRDHVYHVYSLFSADRSAIADRLQGAGIGYGFHYPRALHQHTATQHFAFSQEKFPNAEYVAANQISLPIYPELSIEEVEFVATVVGKGT
jgi:dTDP-4-amino-4,6-dideoxygalactose transaminase